MTAFGASVLALLLAATTPTPETGGWQDRDGKAIADTPASKSKDGFSAMLLVTSDADWEAKWNTPREVTPHFSEASEVSAGGKLFILTFLGNPGVNANGETNVECDIVVSRPDGSRSVDLKDAACFKVKLSVEPRSVFMTNAHMEFLAEPDDPRGTWQVRVVMKDRVKGVELPLETAFTLK
jgi:hypothetical protein